MGNLMFKISNLFLGSGLATLDAPQKNAVFGNIGVFFGNILLWAWELFARFVYVIVKFILNIVDFFQYFVQELVGVNAWRQGNVNLNNIGESDLIFKFIFHETVQKAFKYMLGIFFVLLIIFTIIAIVKNEYEFAVASDLTKASNSKMEVFKSSLKAIFLVFIIPLFIVMGVLSSNAILASILNALSGGKNVTFGGQIFTASAYNANKYRVYANAGVRIPVTNNGSVWVDSDGDDVVDTGEEQLISSSIPTVIPNEFKSKNQFTGYMFELAFDGETQNLLYYVKNESDATNVYSYITSTLGGTVIHPTDVEYQDWGYDGDGNGDGDGIKLSLNACEKESSVNQAAYNTWFYNEILTRNFSFEETYEKSPTTTTLGSSATPYHTYTNKGEWAKLHDGGANGLVALPQEYLANADVLDYMINSNLELSVVSVFDAKIKWGDVLTSDLITLIKNTTDDTTKVEAFGVQYSNGENVLYQPKDTNSEEEGAIFIWAYKNPTVIDNEGKVTDYEYVPLLHNKSVPLNTIKADKDASGDWTYSLVASETGNPQFESLKYEYQGLVVARGIIETTYSEINGRPTQIVKSSGDLNFERDVIDNSKINIDFCMNVLNLFGDGVNWRSRISLGTSYGESETEKSKFIAENGVFNIDYNFISADNPGISLSTFFIAGNMNVIILVFASVLLMLILGQAVWGLIARIYDIALYFLVMPGVVATIPFKSSKIYSNWQTNLIKKVFGAYGVLIGLNVYFVLQGPMREASKLFTAADIQHAVGNGNFFANISAAALNNIVYLLFTLVAITLIKTLPATISSMFAFEDSYAQGKDVKAKVTEAVKGTGEVISGKKAISTFENVVGKRDPKTGEWQAGLVKNFIPGSAVIDKFKAKKKSQNSQEETAKSEEVANNMLAEADKTYSSAGLDTGYGEKSDRLENGAGDDIRAIDGAEESTNIDEASLTALKTDLLAELRIMLAEAKAEQSRLKSVADANPLDASAQTALKNAQDRVKAIQSSIDEVNDAKFDADGIDNKGVNQYGRNQKLRRDMQTRKYSTDLSVYGETLSLTARQELGALSVDKKDLDSKRKATQDIVEKLKKNSTSSIATKKVLTAAETKQLLEKNGLEYDEKLKVASYKGDRPSARFAEYDLASQSDIAKFKNMVTTEQAIAAQARLQQKQIASGLAERMVARTEGKPIAGSTVRAESSVGAETKDVRAAKGYAEASKAYAEASKAYSNVATGKSNVQGEPRNATERRLQKLLQKQEKRDEQQEQGNAKTFIASKEKRDEAYLLYNKDKSLRDSIISKSSEAVQEAAFEKYNKIQEERAEALGTLGGKKYRQNLIYDKEKDKTAYNDAAKEYFEENFKGEKYNVRKAQKEFDKYQSELKEQALNTHFDEVVTDAKIAIWNKTHSGEQQIVDAKDMIARGLTKRVDKAFEQDQENKRYEARNNYINDKLDEKIAKQKERVEFRNGSGFIGYALKSTVGKALKMVSRKTTAKDIEQIQERLSKQDKLAEERRENIAYLDQKIQEHKDTVREKTKEYNALRDKEKVSPLTKDEKLRMANALSYMVNKTETENSLKSAKRAEEASLEVINRQREKLNQDLNRGRRGFIHDIFAKKIDGVRRAKKATKAIEALRAKEDKLDKRVGISERVRSRVYGEEKKFSLGTDKDGNDIIRTGYFDAVQTRQLERAAKSVRMAKNRLDVAITDAKNAKPEEVKEKNKQVNQRMKLLKNAQDEFDKTINKFKKANGDSYITKKETELSRVKKQRLQKEKQELFRQMEKAVIRGDDTAGYIEAIESKENAIKKLESVAPRFVKLRNLQAVTIRSKEARQMKVMSRVPSDRRTVKEFVTDTVTSLPVIKRAVRVHKAKQYLADGESLDRTYVRHSEKQNTLEASREVAKVVTQEQYVRRISAAILKHGKKDIVSLIKDSDSARSILQSEISRINNENLLARQAVKDAVSSVEKYNAINKQKELKKSLDALKRLLKLEVPAKVDDSTIARVSKVDTSRADDARRRASSSIGTKSSSKSRGKSTTSESTGSGTSEEIRLDTPEAQKVIKKEVERQLREQKSQLQLAIADATRRGNEAEIVRLKKQLTKTNKDLAQARKEIKKISGTKKYAKIPKIEDTTDTDPEGK